MSPPIPLSIFALLRADLGEDVEVLRCTKATLVQISHAIEDTVLRHRIPALLFTGFQESSHWREETERYRALAEVAQQVCIFAGAPLPPESEANQIHVTLSGDDPLRQEWFLAILSTHFSLILCGQDQAIPTVQEATREFDTIWSFQPDIVNRVFDRIEMVLEHYRPERLEMLRTARANTPIGHPDPALITRLTSDLVRYQERLHRSLHTAAHRVSDEIRLRADLIETLVHDMRSPLQSMMQTLSFVRDTPDLDPETRNEMLELGMLASANLNRLVQTILDTNQLEAGSLKAEIVPIVPERLIEQTITPLLPILDRAKIRFESSISPTLKVMMGDHELLSRVLQNLISNAVRFTPSNGTIRIEVELTHDQFVQFRIRDTGIGIEPDILPNIFQRYYRSGGESQRGSGIGLYFCRLAIEAHNGTIRADSQIGVGTAITFTVPLRPTKVY